MSRSAREIVEQVRRMVAGEGVVFADLFAVDGVLEYPFAAIGQPGELRGREAIRAYFTRSAQSASPFLIDGVDAVVHETTDPEVVIAEIEHHGLSTLTRKPYRFLAIGVIRVRAGEIVSYRDYMNPLALAELLGRSPM